MHTPIPIRARPSRDTCQSHAHRRRLAASPARPTIDLAPRTVEQIAQRVAQLLRQDQLTANAQPTAAPASLLTVKELARHLKLNPAWVYEHAHELGAIRTGNGPKARMRFDLQTATQALKRHQQPEATSPPPKQRPSSSAPYGSDAPVLRARDPYSRGVRNFFSRRPRRRLGVG